MADFAQHAPAALESIAARLSKQTEGCLVDFRIKCGEREWKVHKVILAMHSPVLEAACTRDFQEANQGYIDLSAEDERSLEALVSYLYSFKYDSELAAGDVSFHVKMSILADKYDIPPLQAIASEWYKRSANHNFIIHDRDGFCSTLKAAYDAPAATKEIRAHMVKLIIENKIDITGFEQIMREYADFAADIALAQQSKHKDIMASDAALKTNEKRVECPSCANQWICPIASPPLTNLRLCIYCGQRMQENQWQKYVRS